MTVVILGADPGVTTGLCLLTLDYASRTLALAITSRSVFACNAGAAYGLAEYLIESNDGPATIIGAGERFVPGRGAGATGPQAAATRQVITDLSSLPVPWKWRSAAEVKVWATDERLKKAHLFALTNKSIDARDACRHAIYCATRDCGMPDPLSRRQADGPS